MDKPIHCCETCDYEGTEGVAYEDEGIFECDACYDARLDEYDAAFDDYKAMKDYAAIHTAYPHLDAMNAMQQADPIGFYLACKDNPEALDY